ncbi:cyclopropane-fatty-acyl-phospholipid synthase, partial [Candidatus Uhrbacteria bacterium]|nr:cyclopropane-fatty-acyl-phospholipid synthase [Candidatus Uhrbacteria bacterium]
MSRNRALTQKLLDPADITLDGPNPWDPQVHDDSIFGRLFRGGTIAIGETYMEKLWDVDDMAELIA